MSEWTDDQIVHAIADAITDGATDAVDSLLRLLSRQNPALAVDVFDTMRLGLVLAAGEEDE